MTMALLFKCEGKGCDETAYSTHALATFLVKGRYAAVVDVPDGWGWDAIALNDWRCPLCERVAACFHAEGSREHGPAGEVCRDCQGTLIAPAEWLPQHVAQRNVGHE